MRVGSALGWSRFRWQRRQLAIAGACLAILLLALAAFSWLVHNHPSFLWNSREAPLPADRMVITLPPSDLLRPLAPTEAVEENAKRGFSSRPDSAAAAFRLRGDAASRARALECLAQAVYYEAAAEGIDGGRAVAQVVLNRMRHPAYPASVCGVVYQGAERATGCQFTFTCDGSLARVPSRYLWTQARRIASEALAGKVFGPVGHTTHYHADYVLPYWADSLDKSIKIGRHIFYRLKGSIGSAGLFRQRYAGNEPIPPLPSSVAVALEAIATAEEPDEAQDQSINGLEAPTGELIAMTQQPQKPAPLADKAPGTLIIDEGTIVITRPENKRGEACPASNKDRQLQAMAANDVRIRPRLPEC